MGMTTPAIKLSNLSQELATLIGEEQGKMPMTISFDLDNLWSYQKTHGDPGWETYPSYLDILCEICLPLFSQHNLKLTLFIVGQDAAQEKNRNALLALSSTGHEIANHSFHHEPWLHLYSPEEVQREFDLAESAILDVTGKQPRGFRGPGFSVSDTVVHELSKRGYLYDASTLPTFLGPLARAYYFWSSKGLSRDEKQQRKQLFGKFSEGFRPINPYFWNLGETENPVLEIPVTTMPILRFPIHLSYIGYLAGHSLLLARLYLRLAINLCRVRRVFPSFLLHPLDFLGFDQVRELSFFPGMQLKTDYKVRLFNEVISYLKQYFEPVTLEQYASAICSTYTQEDKG